MKNGCLQIPHSTVPLPASLPLPVLCPLPGMPFAFLEAKSHLFFETYPGLGGPPKPGQVALKGASHE